MTMKRHLTELLLIIACWFCNQNEVRAQFLPQSYTIPQTTALNNGNGTQAVTYSWSALAPDITTVYLLYGPVGGNTWSVAATGGPVSPQTANIPVGTYQYAIGLNSTSNVVLMNSA